jgi:hypothetical protein
MPSWFPLSAQKYAERFQKLELAEQFAVIDAVFDHVRTDAAKIQSLRALFIAERWDPMTSPIWTWAGILSFFDVLEAELQKPAWGSDGVNERHQKRQSWGWGNHADVEAALESDVDKLDETDWWEPDGALGELAAGPSAGRPEEQGSHPLVPVALRGRAQKLPKRKKRSKPNTGTARKAPRLRMEGFMPRADAGRTLSIPGLEEAHGERNQPLDSEIPMPRRSDPEVLGATLEPDPSSRQQNFAFAPPRRHSPHNRCRFQPQGGPVALNAWKPTIAVNPPRPAEALVAQAPESLFPWELVPWQTTPRPNQETDSGFYQFAPLEMSSSAIGAPPRRASPSASSSDRSTLEQSEGSESPDSSPQAGGASRLQLERTGSCPCQAD